MAHGFHVFNTHEPGVEEAQTSQSAMVINWSPPLFFLRLHIVFPFALVLMTTIDLVGGLYHQHPAVEAEACAC